MDHRLFQTAVLGIFAETRQVEQGEVETGQVRGGLWQEKHVVWADIRSVCLPTASSK